MRYSDTCSQPDTIQHSLHGLRENVVLFK